MTVRKNCRCFGSNDALNSARIAGSASGSSSLAFGVTEQGNNNLCIFHDEHQRCPIKNASKDSAALYPRGTLLNCGV
jgi:hypothetical protein